jgi:transposase-like protein
MYQQTVAEQQRQIRGIGIVSIGRQIKCINKLHYRVISQSDDSKWYDIVKEYGHNPGGHQEGKWTCTCPDYQFRHSICKHVYAVLEWKKSKRQTIPQDVVLPIPNSQSEYSECIKCKSSKIVKDGRRYNKSGLIQKYLCRDCSYRFVINIGFENTKKSPKVICAAIDLYLKGISLRKVADHIRLFYGVSVADTSVLRWVQKFADVVAPLVNNIMPPHLSGVYNVDEMVVHVRKEEMTKGHYQWLWNLMDDSTRFWVSSKISQRREVSDARAVFQDAKNKTLGTKAIIHDGLQSYDEAFQKEYYTRKNPRVKNIRSISVRNKGLNSRIERLNGIMRDREKVMRGMNKAESAQKLIEAFRIHYNFCREHSALGKTPAEAAGIKLDLGQNKIENLIKMSKQLTDNDGSILMQRV